MPLCKALISGGRDGDACGAGLDHLWRIVLDAPDARISDRARKSLVTLHVHLAEDLQPRRTDIRQAFLQ